MNRKGAYTLAGAAIGFFLGISTGVAAGGTAYNGTVIFVPIGAFIGWLISLRVIKPQRNPTAPLEAGDIPEVDTLKTEPKIEKTHSTQSGDTSSANVFGSAIAILAMVWNFHIEIIRMVKLLPVFLERPWLFLVLAVVVSVFFPPFLVGYFCCYLGAAHFGISEDTEFKATIMH